MLKDMRTATDLAAQLGVPVDLGDAAVERWAEGQANAVRQFRAMTGRAQTAVPVTPAMLAQIADLRRRLRTAVVVRDPCGPA